MNKTKSLTIALLSSGIIVTVMIMSVIMSLAIVSNSPKKSSEIIVLGDSTAALSTSETVYNPCKTDNTAWPSLINAHSLACSGSRIDKAYDIARSTPYIGQDTKYVFMTIGTNSLRSGMTTRDAAIDIQKIIDIINIKAPHAHVYLVGYLPVHDVECLSEYERESFYELGKIHDMANISLRNAAQETSSSFISVDDFSNKICSSPLIYPPGTGVDWHTTPRGHDMIAQRISDVSGIKIKYTTALDLIDEQ